MSAPDSNGKSNGASAWRAVAIALIVSIGSAQAGFNAFVIIQLLTLQKECRP
jgi:hypothetical protein